MFNPASYGMKKLESTHLQCTDYAFITASSPNTRTTWAQWRDSNNYSETLSVTPSLSWSSEENRKRLFFNITLDGGNPGYGGHVMDPYKAICVIRPYFFVRKGSSNFTYRLGYVKDKSQFSMQQVTWNNQPEIIWGEYQTGKTIAQTNGSPVDEFMFKEFKRTYNAAVYNRTWEADLEDAQIASKVSAEVLNSGILVFELAQGSGGSSLGISSLPGGWLYQYSDITVNKFRVEATCDTSDHFIDRNSEPFTFAWAFVPDIDLKLYCPGMPDQRSATVYYRNKTESAQWATINTDTNMSVTVPPGTFTKGKIEWYIQATDSTGRTTKTAKYAFSAFLKLGVSCSREAVTTTDSFSISLSNPDDETISVILSANGRQLMHKSSAGDPLEINCDKAWFDRAVVITNNSLQVKITASDRLGREAVTTVNVSAGDDMLPKISLLKTKLVQHEKASAFPDIYIAGYSRCAVSADVKAQTDAAITSVICAYGNTLEQMIPVGKGGGYGVTTKSALSGNTVFTVTATDERGLSSVKSIAVNGVYAYTPPSSTIDTMYRCDENGEEAAGGEYLSFRSKAQYDERLPGNGITKFILEIENGPSFPLENGVTNIYPHGRGTKKIFLRVIVQDKLSDEIIIERTMIGGITVLEAYNELVTKYKPFNGDLEYIPVEIIGYPALMEAYYNTIDMRIFLESGLMPNIEVSSTDAEREAAKLTATNLSPVAVANLDSCSDASAESAILSMAKCLVRSSYQVKVGEGSYNSSTHKWTGKFIVTNYGDEEDTAESSSVTITITGDMEEYIRQKLKKAMARESNDATDVTKLFAMENTAFTEEMKKYSLNSLTSFREICQACMDIMIQNGVSGTGGNLSYNSSLYNNLYTPYSQKAAIIEAEMERRQIELEVVAGKYDAAGNLIQPGAQTVLDGERIEINAKLDFTGFLGDSLWKEFSSYRREDSLNNQNYISDGLTNSELFVNAEAFLDAAEHEIYKSAESQHSIEGDMHNILTMQEFQPLVYDFCVGNWIRVGVDGDTHKLRLYSYEIDFDTMDFDVKFTDLQKGRDTASDVNDLLSRVKSLSSSYQATTRDQAVNKNTSTIKQKMAASEGTGTGISGSSTSSGVINGRVENDTEDGYEPTQYKITPYGIQTTKDNWQTSKLVLGAYAYYDPISNTERSGYGVTADYLDGSMRIGNSGGVFNSDGSLTIDKDRISISVDSTGNTKGLKIKRGTGTGAKTLFDVNTEGELVVGDLNAAGGALAVDGNVSVSGTFDSAGKTTLSNGVDVTGNAAITGNETISGDETVAGLAKLNGGLKVTGDSEFAGGLTVKGSAQKHVTVNTDGEISSTGNASVGGALEVKGAAALKGGLTVTGAASVSGNGTFGGTLGVTGDVTMNRKLDVAGNTTVGGTFSATGASTAGGTLTANSTANSTIGANIYNLFRNIVNTSSNGRRAMYPYNMTSPYCGDIGESTLDANGENTISFETIFLQTISTSGYQVFLQPYGEGSCYVSARTGTGFTVKGTPNLKFGWEVKAKSKSYGSRRLEAV